MNTTKITNVVKIAEFPELADAYVDAFNNKNELQWPIVDLLQKQTEAKQTKFWRFVNANYFCCDTCGNLVRYGKAVKTSRHNCCSMECAYKALGVTKVYESKLVAILQPKEGN